MKIQKWMISILLLTLFMCVPTLKSDAVTVQSVIGSSVNCDTTIALCTGFPTQVSLLCNGSGGTINCPQFFEPDWTTTTRLWGITNRVVPPKLVVSTDGGTTWTLGTTDPFIAAIVNFGANFAVSSNGSLLAAAGQGANTCIIRRSTDQGVSWSTVYTEAVNLCDIAFGNPTSNSMTCAASGGYCVLFARDAGFNIFPITSTNNGATWTAQTSYSYVSGDTELQVQLSADASSGVQSRMTNNGVGFATKSGNTFVYSATAIPNSQRCMGLIIGGTKVVCGPSSILTTAASWQFADAVNPAAPSTFAVVDGQSNSQSPQPLVVGFTSTLGYMLLPSQSNANNLNVFITNNSFGAVTKIATVTPITIPIAGCCRGDAYVFGGKIYFGSGASGPNAFVMVIQ